MLYIYELALLSASYKRSSWKVTRFMSCTVIVWEFALLVVMLVWVLLWVTRSETPSIPFSSRENDGEVTLTNYFVSTNSNTSSSLRLSIDYPCFLSKWTGGKLLSYSSEVSSCYALNLHSTWRILSDDYLTIWLKIITWSYLGSLVSGTDFSHRCTIRERGSIVDYFVFPRVCILWFCFSYL